MAIDFASGLGIFKTMIDLAKGVKDASDASIRNRASIELQEQILTAQQQQSALVEKISGLEAQVAKFEAWDAEKKRYILKKLPPGVFSYALKPEMADGEPPHYICKTCYGRRIRSVLDEDRPVNGVHYMTCHECKTELLVGILEHTGDSNAEWNPFRED